MSNENNGLSVSLRIPKGLQEFVVVGAATLVVMLCLSMVSVLAQSLGWRPLFGLLIKHTTTVIALTGALFSVGFAGGRWLWRRHVTYLNSTHQASLAILLPHLDKRFDLMAETIDIMQKDVTDTKKDSAETKENVKRINGNVTRHTEELQSVKLRQAEMRAYLEGQGGKPLGSLEAKQ